jgi:hypothetical protein
MSIWNREKNLSLKRVTALLQEPLQDDLGRRLRVFSLLLDDIYARLREHNICMRLGEAARDCECVHNLSLVVLIRYFSFSVRAVGSLLLVGYVALREARRRVNATLAEMVMCALAGGVLNLAVIFGFRQTVGQISGIQYMAFASLETFLIVELVTRVVLYFRWLRHA